MKVEQNSIEICVGDLKSKFKKMYLKANGYDENTKNLDNFPIVKIYHERDLKYPHDD